MAIVSKIAGHNSTKSTQHYVHDSEAARKSLKRKSPLDLMDVKVKKLKISGDLAYSCPVKDCKYTKGERRGHK